MMAKTNAEIIAIERMLPAGSRGAGWGSRLSGTSHRPAVSAIATMGAFTRNTEPHQNASSSDPPISGPSPIPRPATADQILIAFPRSSRGKTSVMTDSVDGMIIEAPRPISARIAIS